jgi:hypothetical protein
MKLTTITLALVAGAALTALCGAARGEEDPMTGNGWVQNCPRSTAQLTPKEIDAFVRQAVCAAYVRGFAEGLKLWEATERDTVRICIPVGVTGFQLSFSTRSPARTRTNMKKTGGQSCAH